jgi:hypothetical protein
MDFKYKTRIAKSAGLVNPRGTGRVSIHRVENTASFAWETRMEEMKEPISGGLHIFEDTAFRLLALPAFECPQVISRLVRLDAREHRLLQSA